MRVELDISGAEPVELREQIDMKLDKPYGTSTPTACSSLRYARLQSKICRARNANVLVHVSVRFVFSDSFLSLAPVAYSMGDMSVWSFAEQAPRRIDGF